MTTYNKQTLGCLISTGNRNDFRFTEYKQPASSFSYFHFILFQRVSSLFLYKPLDTTEEEEEEDCSGSQLFVMLCLLRESLIIIIHGLSSPISSFNCITLNYTHTPICAYTTYIRVYIDRGCAVIFC